MSHSINKGLTIMAKKRKLELDKYGFSSELDVPEFNFDVPELKDNRTPVSKIIGGAKDGFITTFSEPSFVAKIAKDALPRFR